MNYRGVVGYIDGVSVLFELEDGNFALVSVNAPKEARYLIQVARYLESFTKFAFFKFGEAPEEMVSKAARILGKGEKVFMSKDLK